MWHSLREVFRQLGISNGILYLVHRALHSVSGGRARLVRYYLVAQPVPSVQKNKARPSSVSSVREVMSSDAVVEHFPRPPAVVSQRFASDSVCYVAEVRGRFAGFLWLAFGGYDEDEVRCRYEFHDPAKSVWDYDVYVEPQFRLGRTFVRLWEAANQRLSDDGVQWSFSRISAFNAGSLAAHRRMGMDILFSVNFLCLGPVQLTVAATRPFLHLGWSEKSRPVFSLRQGTGR